VETKTYKGIAYTIRSLGNDQWQWMIRPPLSVRGLKSIDGMATGSISRVAELVQTKIDEQIEIAMPSRPN